ncbi:MAG: hypothetical protein WD379_09170 [Dehalococcoidia bacterium]
MRAENLDLFADLIGRAFTNAMLGFAQITGKRIEVTSFSVRSMEVTQVCRMLGGASEVVAGVYLTAQSSSANVLLIFEPRIARVFVELLTGTQLGPEDATGEEMEQRLIDMAANGSGSGELQRSALEEMGNITGSLLLNGLAEVSDMSLLPSPPRVIVDMLGAIMDLVAADFSLSHEDVLVADASFRTSTGEAAGRLLFVPSSGLVGALEGQDK